MNYEKIIIPACCYSKCIYFYSGFSSFSSDQINRMNSFATSIGQTTNKKVTGLNLQFNEDLVSTIHEYCEETNSTGIIEVYENTEGFIKRI